ncbi:excinuclease ABC subunit UvrA [Candidatus Enterococcus clewellii]|uniref:UvrABC system protein A n=1 Tax=Candidatus Enterococcus clewellii TaxID=1834193 RepID=A0A242JZ56_9ENTE|nr:excinuclease ABC subunit UvrA [Enterococcus sp. 9E7_DIV0242]OTP10600.1 excinuclease ABC subunit A [Enterococcus sp. 9E7_DIV0242]
MDRYELKAIGTVHKEADMLVVEMTEKRLTAAMKNLSLFSHATFIFSDGRGRLKVRVLAMSEVDEKNGRLVLAEGGGLLEGNAVYDIKPYIPCEDRLLTEQQMIDTAQPDKAEKTGGDEVLQLASAGQIRKKQGRYFLYPEDFDSFLASISGSEYVKVLWWFSRFDKKEYRRSLQGEPPYENAPRSGVLATRSPVRPNPIALTVVQILAIDYEEQSIEVIGLDCFDRTPFIDIRSYIPSVDVVSDYKVPSWLTHWPEYKELETTSSEKKLVLDDSDEEQLDSFLKTGPSALAATILEETTAEQGAANEIIIHGARQNNLKNIDVVIPKEKIIAVAGVSGSGKSSFAFDTLYAESRLRLSETVDSIEKPSVDTITGLPPAVAIAQRSIGRNPRSTVGTFTGIQDRLRLLYTEIGHRHCPNCGKSVRPRSQDELVIILRQLGSEHDLQLLSYGKMDVLVQSGKGKEVRWEAVVGQALEVGKGAFYLSIDGGEPILLQNREMCYQCQTILFEMTPALFSFNNPESMCSACNGLGKTIAIDPALVVAHPERSVLDEASTYWGDVRAFSKKPTANWMRGELLALANAKGIDLELPWQELPETFRQMALYGSGEEEVSWSYVHPKNGRSGTITRVVEGAIPVLNRLLQKGGNTAEQITMEYMRAVTCPVCEGERLAREGRMVTLAGLRYPQIAAMTMEALLEWVQSLPSVLLPHELQVAQPLLKEIYQKVICLKEVGLSYLTLARTIPTLSGGELQRLKLVAQMGIGLSGLLYVMDEPTAGLHPRDYPSIIRALKQLKEEGNTILVVEHEETMLQAADWLIEIGPGAGQHGGEIIWQGNPQKLFRADTETAQFLTGRKQIQLNRPTLTKWVTVADARENNLKNITVQFPKGHMTCITGVSGSGKSSLVEKVLIPAVEAHLNQVGKQVLCSIEGIEDIQQVIHASQSPVSGNKRSVLATFIGVFDEIRLLFARETQAESEKLTASAFSFNSKEGQCDACKGEGVQTITVPFAADITAVCPTCHGKRYKKQVLDILYEEKNIFEVLALPVEEARHLFDKNKKITVALQTLCDVGLGYLKLGQGIRTLSGGEAQRLKLAKALCKKSSDRNLYVLDEPTSGLHFSDIQNLLELLATLAEAGHTVVIVEHNQQVIRNVDWIIDLGPEGGAGGGNLVVQGTPETVRKCRDSYTGRFI